MKKLLEKNGFIVEGKFKSEVLYNKKRYSHSWCGKINEYNEVKRQSRDKKKIINFLKKLY